MISLYYAKRYCRDDISMIENYDKALADATQTWICHHRNAEPFTGFCTKDLKKMNMYYNRPASELKFVTSKMHEDIHGSCKTAGKANKGKHLSADVKQKISESEKGKCITSEHKCKISCALSGKHKSEQHRSKLSKAILGRHWYNNGVINVQARECPLGFKKGRLKHET